MARRDALKALGAGVLAASGAWMLGRNAAAAAPELRYPPEKGAQLRFLRWKRFVQGDEDQWLASTRKFTEQTGVPVQVESVSLEDLPSKAAMAANVGAGPDIVMGSYGQPQLYPDKCLDLTELANYLADKYGGWYDAVKAYCTTDGRWIALGLAFPTSCVVYRESMVKAAGFSEIPRDLDGFLKLCRALSARGTPPGFALGNAIGDGTTWCHWLVWSHGGKLVDESGRVVINSKADHRRARVCQGAVSDTRPRHAVVARPEQQQGVSGGPGQPHLQRHLDLLRRQELPGPGAESDRSRHAACALPGRPGRDGRPSCRRSHRPGCSTTRGIRMLRASTCASCSSATSTRRG